MGNPFNNFYSGKRVLVTGHTGFKGSWLVLWLKKLGAEVIGYSTAPLTDPNHFDAAHISEKITSVEGDILEPAAMEQAFQAYNPDIVFHLAAQSLVRESYKNPADTFNVNVMGTVNVLEAARKTASVKAVIIVTSDKCYKNVGWEWGYRETDTLGGFDAYSASKAAAEVVTAAYQDLKFQQSTIKRDDLAIASVRAGNAIGGGDWSTDRLIPDIVRAIEAGEDVVIRNPNSTRPWQHVLEPLSGYLWLAYKMSLDSRLYASAWNFGPAGSEVYTVGDIVSRLLKRWQPPSTQLVVQQDQIGSEAFVLHVDSSKAGQRLAWRSAWDVDEMVNAVVHWYRFFSEEPSGDIAALTCRQIDEYTAAAANLKIAWAESSLK